MIPQEYTRFDALPIRVELQKALDTVNYVQMTPVQARSAKPILEGHDLLVQAETGSGKTAAFAIGLLNKLDITNFRTQALVICPTRELSDQIAGELRKLACNLANTRVLTLCGGKPMHDQLNSLRREPHVVVGTPGRLLKHLKKGSLDLSNLTTLVLDEADRMLDMGFYDDITNIIHFTNDARQTLLFSATYPPEIMSISRNIQRDPIEVRLEPQTTSRQITQHFYFADDEQKLQSLYRVLGKFRPENAIIFCNRKQQAQELYESLKRKGFHSRALHGDLDQRQRDEAIMLFANNSISILVATDVAARGLDITALSAVINYDVSTDPETHLHRIGRTGRAGLEGRAITFITPDEMNRARAIEQYSNAEITFGELHAADAHNGATTLPQTRTIQISAGKKDKIRPGDIVGALTADTQLAKDDIGKITVQAKSGFVAIAYTKAPIALKILSEGKIKKRKVRARIIS